MSRSNLRSVILITGLVTALVHLVVLNISYLQEEGRPDVLFTLNGLGYLALLAAFRFRPGFVSRQSELLHYVFIAYTAATIGAWVLFGSRDLTGWTTKLDELILIYALFAHLRAEQAASGSPSRATGP